ncbi:MAG: MSCRAMM family protein, partial [Planctomycetota bacterium]
MRGLALPILLLLAARAAAADLTVEVRTVGADGREKPVVGARVVVTSADRPVFAEDALRESDHETDSDGLVGAPRTGGRSLVLAGIPGRGIAYALVDPVEKRTKLVLPQEAVLTALVLDPAGRPVAGAEVLLAPERPEDTRGFLAPGVPVFRGRTDRAGRLVFYRLAEGTRYRLRASATGLARAVLRDLAPTERPHEVRLTPGATVRGTLYAIPGGEPVAGAVVRLGESSTRSREDGRFELVGVPAGSYRLEVQSAGHLHVEEAELVLADGEAREGLTVRLLGMGRLKGRVLSPTTRPASGAEIFLRYPPDPDLRDRLPPDRTVRAGTTDEDGRFDVKGLIPAQGVDLIARHPEYAPAAYRGYSIIAAQTVEA